jgi:hypothetical protein
MFVIVRGEAAPTRAIARCWLQNSKAYNRYRYLFTPAGVRSGPKLVLGAILITVLPFFRVIYQVYLARILR